MAGCVIWHPPETASWHRRTFAIGLLRNFNAVAARHTKEAYRRKHYFAIFVVLIQRKSSGSSCSIVENPQFQKKNAKKKPSSRPSLRTASPTPCKYRSRCYPVKEPCERWKSAPGRNTQRVFFSWDGFFHSPGPAPVVRRVLRLEAALAAKRLAINFNKCELYDPAGGAQPLFDNSPS